MCDGDILVKQEFPVENKADYRLHNTLMHVQQRVNKTTYKKATLYAFIFESILVKMAVIAMFALLLLQPIAPVFAFEEESQNEESEVIVATDPVTIVEEVTEVVVEDESILDEVIAEPETVLLENAEPEAESTLPYDEIVVTATTSEVEEIDDEVEVSEVPQQTATSTDEEVLETETATTTPEDIEEVAEVIEQEVEESVASTTATTTVEQFAGTVHNAASFSFDTTECAVVGDGAYYCSDKKSEVESIEDGVFSEKDIDGDLEIFVRVNGEQRQVSHNTVDDSAPQFDAISKRIVWHGLVDDRYQIFSYDTDSKEITRLTSTSYNNMEPMAYGEVTLWQAWIDNNWEIMLYDGVTKRQITNNTQNDVSPHMREGYVVWQTQFDDAWQVAVYDQETKAVEYISSEGGLKVENPRFVLVYDSTDKNGDSRTVGYDFDSKSSFDLGVLPQELPEELPEPDQTGETRALIQNKQSSREGEQEVIDVEPQTVPNSTSTEETPLTLDLSGGPAASTSTIQSGTVEDVVIPSFTSTSSLSQVTFESNDLVIPPYTASTTQ